MSENNSTSNQGTDSNIWKWATLGLIAFVVPITVGQAIVAKAKQAQPLPVVEEQVKVEEPASVAPQPRRAPKVVASNAAPAPVAPRTPSSYDIAACNQAAETARTQTVEVVRDGVVGGALGAGVGAATGAIVKGGKGAGKGAAIGGVVGATAGTLYGVNKKSQDDARAQAAYSTCMAQRGF
jgi:uncharacterized protein YcfJ